ncbi:type VI secretion system Vgr family protein [Pseudomonas alvandae]|uniref:type VI secretion system Vgr family protein n=1 Tax=Pseudomonas canavaninivorans TaxID=2842348 RepID=UPI002FEEFE10
MRNDMENPFSLTIMQSDMRLHVLGLNGREALNQPYRFDLDLIGQEPPISPDALLGQAAFLRLDGESGIHGIVHSVSLSAEAAHRVGYRLTLVPYIQQLEQGLRRRVFHRLTVVQILQRLLEENAIPALSYRFELPNGHYPCRPFCIQYEESDLTLLQRLCEEEGIHYHFEHSPLGHVMVFAEDPKSFPVQAVELLMEADKVGAITRLYQRHHSIPPGPPHGFRDRAAAETTDTANPASEAAHERKRDDPTRIHRFQAGRRHLERLRYRKREIHGHTLSPALRSGHIARIDGHPVSTFNDQWLVTEVRHRGRQFSILETNLPTPPAAKDYCNQFCAIPWSSVYRPLLVHPKPCVPGNHLAYVLGPPGQAATSDLQGRVMVSLWNRDDEGIALPVSCLTPGDHPSLLAGSEVLVSFLDGDPDRPVLCVGLLEPGPGNGGPTSPHPLAPSNNNTGLLFEWLLNPPDITP